MKILYVITKSNWGGAQRHVFDLATAMKDKGHDVYVALGGEGILKKRLEAAGIYTFSIAALGRDVSLGKDFNSFKEIWNVIRNKRPDIVHLHSTKVTGLGSVAARLLRVKLVVQTIHGWAFNEDRPIHERLAIRIFSWITMLLCHRTILLSEFEYSQAMSFPWIKEKLKLIPLGVKAPTFMSVDGAKQTIAKMVGLDVPDFNKRTVIGTIAELHRNKGLTYLINAMAAVVQEYPAAICIVIGDGEEKAALGMLIQERKLEKNFFLAGYLEHASEYLKAFSVFTLPSVKEGLPYTILEAGQASLPVIATPVGGIPEIVEDMRSGILVQARNQRELAHAISFMIEHPIERKQYGTALREKIATKFSMETMINSLQELYSKPN
jgi:glycosyltransferase involved in cell wall biosynthesis